MIIEHHKAIFGRSLAPETFGYEVPAKAESTYRTRPCHPKWIVIQSKQNGEWDSGSGLTGGYEP